MSPSDLNRALHRRALSDRFVLGGFIMLLVGLLGLGVVQGTNVSFDKGQGSSISEIKGEIKDLCLSGAIDCTGTSDLPPPQRGVAGTGIKAVSCTKGQFRFTFTTGRVSSVGRCVAGRGPRGLPGQIGLRGPRGATGTVSTSQILAVASRVLAAYCAARHQCLGPRGPRGLRGLQGLRGLRGPRGLPGLPDGGGHHGLLCLVVRCHRQ